MRTRSILSLSLALAASAGATPTIQVELGASHFWLRNTHGEDNVDPLRVDEPTKTAPFVAATYAFNQRFGLRLSYHYLDNVETAAEFGHPPGEVVPQVVVLGRFRDDVHVVSLAPEFNWNLTPRLKFAIAPQVNWVASRGVVSYATNDPSVLLVGPRERDADGFTLAGSTRLIWALGERAAVSLGYHYIDFDPSFGRTAQVLSGGLLWTF
ncbi:MAG TPA: hypothetical protein VGD81_16165 [Opitutaceae bacterium]